MAGNSLTPEEKRQRKEALQAFQSASRKWEFFGMPQEGPIFDQLNTTRQAYLDAPSVTDN